LDNIHKRRVFPFIIKLFQTLLPFHADVHLKLRHSFKNVCCKGAKFVRFSKKHKKKSAFHNEKLIF